MIAADLRIRRGKMTQKEVGKEIPLHQVTLTDIERGRIGIDDETYDRIMRAIERVRERKQMREGVTAQ